MGVFEFVLAIIFMSFVFKTINLRYESQKNNQTGREANSLGLNSAMDKQEQRVPQEKAAKIASRAAAGSSSRWLLLCLMACCFIPMAVFLFGSLAYQPAEMSTMPTVPLEINELPEAPSISEAVPIPPTATPWERELTDTPDEFLANVYPSIVDCAAPMAIKIYNEISDRLPTESPDEAEDSGDAEKDEDDQNKIAEQESPEPTEVYITNGGVSDQDYLPFVVAFRKKIESKIKNSSVRDVSGQNTDYLKPPKSLYRVVVSSIQKKINGETDYSAGRVVCKVKGKNTSTEVITNYAQKLWLTDFQAFEAKNPDKQYVVGRCDEFFPQQSQARERALKNVLDDAIATDVGVNLEVRDFSYRHVDSFIQKYERPYGDVFRCAVLLELDLDHPAMAASATSINPAPESSFLASAFDCGWKPSFEWSVAMLIGLTVFVGMISNVLTQGYYQTEISRTVYVALAFGTCALIIFVGMVVSEFVYIPVFYGIFAFVVILVLAFIDRAKKI